MRTVHPTGMIAHLWAHRSQDHARNPQGNFYFDGDTIYSYRDSFPIARHVEHRGKKAILFTTRAHSRTTSDHIRDVGRAIPDGIPVFRVLHVATKYGGENHAENIQEYSYRIVATSKELANPRIRDRGSRESRILDLNGERNAYAKFFGLRIKPITGTVAEIAARCREQCERIETSERRRLVKAERERRSKLAADVERWKAGERVSIGYNPDTLLRIKGDNLETSMGAEIPLDHARRAFPAILRCRQNGSTWERNGQHIHVGHFQIDAIDSEGNIKAGCHRIEWPEIERIARQLDLIH